MFQFQTTLIQVLMARHSLHCIDITATTLHPSISVSTNDKINSLPQRRTEQPEVVDIYKLLELYGVICQAFVALFGDNPFQAIERVGNTDLVWAYRPQRRQFHKQRNDIQSRKKPAAQNIDSI